MLRLCIFYAMQNTFFAYVVFISVFFVHQKMDEYHKGITSGSCNTKNILLLANIKIIINEYQGIVW